MRRRLPSWPWCAPLLLAAVSCSANPQELSWSEPLKKNSSGGGDAYRPMAIESESFQKRWSGTDPSCFGVDDQYFWRAAGSLRPGESYTFNAMPTCDYAEMPAIAVTASWDASDLEVTSAAPADDGISGDPTQAGTPIIAASLPGEAHLCMFTSAWGAGQGFSYAVTIRNKGSETAYNVTLEGQQTNGWFIYFYNQCVRADADQDGWNDSLEHGMQLLSYYSSYPGPGLKWQALDGANYLKPLPGSASPDDEVDTYPPDVNDDGVVDQADVDRVASFLGQGTGVSLDRIDANPGPNYIYNQTGPWRRYDLDGNGTVSSRDVDMVRALVGKPIPWPEDILAPTVELRSPADGAAVPRGSSQLLQAFASDDQWIERVDFYANGKFLCSSVGGGLTLARNHPFTCWWRVPRKQQNLALSARAYDGAGNDATDSISVSAN